MVFRFIDGAYRPLQEIERLQAENDTLRRAREIDKRYGVQNMEEVKHLRELNETLEYENRILREALISLVEKGYVTNGLTKTL